MREMPDHIEFLSSGSDVEFSEEWYAISDPGHFWFEWRLRVLRHLMEDAGIPLYSDLQMLDIGCGTGLMRDGLEPYTTWNIDVSDLNPEALKQVRPGRGRTLFYDVLDVHNSLVEAYDVISFFDVLEHVPDPGTLIEAGRSHLKEDGWLLVTVPALPCAYSRYDQVVGHLRRYTKEDLTSEIEAQGFTVVGAQYWGLLLLPPLFVRKWLLAGSNATPEQIVRKGMRPSNKIVQMILHALIVTETRCSLFPPVGASLVLVAKKCE
jgi:2-polyprenyl-3-methyl-5-hydroxy-6-metoxy-1,4-benzoquinol methylase